MITKEDLDVMYHPIPKEKAGRIFIGQVPVCEIYHRLKEPTLFEKGCEKWEFCIDQYKKVQPEGEWLVSVPIEERDYLTDSIEDGINWLLIKLNTK